MTTPDRAPEPVDLDAIRDRWLQPCAACDAGLSMSCTCPPGGRRKGVSGARVTEVGRLRARVEQLDKYLTCSARNCGGCHHCGGGFYRDDRDEEALRTEVARTRPVIEAARKLHD